jgi:adenylylsulfate kinase-like enzyme
MTGIDAPYEPPRRPDLALKPLDQSVAESVAAVLGLLGSVGKG